MKKILLLAIFLLFTVITFVSCGNTDRPDYKKPYFEYTLNEDGKSYTIYGAYFDKEKLEIPSRYNGLPVTKIGRRAFTCIKESNDPKEGRRINDKLKEVIIPNTVIEIGEYAFEGVISLEKITIPNSVKIIGSYAFYKSGIKEIKLPVGLKRIESAAFMNTEIAEITLPKSLEFIGVNAFRNCENLKIKGTPVNLTTIEDYAFYGSGIESFELNEKITRIEHNTFAFTKLKSIVIPNQMEYIDKSAFEGCSQLETIVIPKNVIYVGEKAFEGCEKLTIYCEAETLPKYWYKDWNNANLIVEWGYITQE